MTKAVAFGVALVAISACTKKSSDAPPVPKAETAVVEKPTPEAPKALAGDGLAKWYEGCWDSFVAQKWDTFGGCYADDTTSTPLGMPALAGKPTVIGDHKAWNAAFPDATYEPQFTLVSGHDIFAVRWFRGTHTGPFKTPDGDLAATNKKVSMLMLHHVEINDANQAAHEWWAYDVPTLMFQLGKSPGPARAPLDKGWPGAPILVVAKDDDTEHENAAMVKHVYDLWNKRQMKPFYATVADDGVESTNSDPEDVIGKKALEEKNNKEFLAVFSDNHVDVETTWAAGDYTISFERVRGTNDGDMGPIKKTGKKIDWPMFEILKWQGGQSKNSWGFANGMELAVQLGLAPGPGDAKSNSKK